MHTPSKHSPSKPVAVARGRVAALSRSRSKDDPEYVSARQQLKALTLEEHIQKTVSTWPELTLDQLTKLAGLFSTTGGDVK